MSKEFTIQIKGATWLIKPMTPRKFKKEHSHDEWAAVTIPTSKEIHINGDTWLPENIRHEICHAYIQESNTADIDMTPDDMEELCCNIFGIHGIDIINLSDKIITKLQNNS